MQITRKSPFTGKLNTLNLDITEDQIATYNRGALIQVAFPNLTAPEREFILTGYTAEDWETIFGSDEEEG